MNGGIGQRVVEMNQGLNQGLVYRNQGLGISVYPRMVANLL